MTDIVERLRNGGARCDWGTDFAHCPAPDDCEECACAREAADEIDRLRAEVSSLWTVNRAKDRRIDYLVRHTPFWQEYT